MFNHYQALAFTDNWTVVLLIGNGKDYYYDNQEIEISVFETISRIGTYKYVSKNLQEKTVPIIIIE